MGRGWLVSRGQRLLPSFLCAVGAACSAGCSGPEDDRPPPPPPCIGNDCGTPPGGGISAGGGGTGGAAATGGSGNMAGAPSGATKNLSGDVGLLTEDTFTQIISFHEAATVFGEGNGGRVSASYDGTDFTLADVLVGSSVSMAVRPADTTVVFDTLSDTDTTPANVTLPVVQRSVIEDIFLSLTTPTQVARGAAQIVVRVIGTDGVPVRGVGIGAPSAELVAYSSSGSWSDTETATDVSGLAVVGNVVAASFPGGDLTLRLTGAVKVDESVRVARGFVTLVNVVVIVP